MMFGDSIAWSFTRSILIAGTALWPVTILLRQIAACQSVRTRRIWLLLTVFPFFVPELLIGFNYRLTATQLSSGSSPFVAAICTEFLYALLQLARSTATGVALFLLLPRSDVTRESLYSWDLLRPQQYKHDAKASSLPVYQSPTRRDGEKQVHHSLARRACEKLDSLFPKWRRGWLRLRMIGPWQPLLISWSVMALITFQEFETAALMQIDRHPVAWSVWLFDSHAASQPLSDSLRMIVVPLLCELLLLAPALFLLCRSQRSSAASAESSSEDVSASRKSSGNSTGSAVMMLLPGILLFLAWPIAVNALTTANGLVMMMFRGTLMRQSFNQILISTAYAAASTFIAMSVSARICRSFVVSPASRRPLKLIAAGALILPGLTGSLVLSLLLLAAFQTPPLRPLYDTWLPMMIGQSLAVLPKALAVVLLLQKTTDAAAIHSARMLMASSAAGLRRFASGILWRLTTGRWLLGGLIVAHLCFWDVTVSSILHPVELEPVVTRLYNEMHYGRNEALMSLALLAALTPLAAAGVVMFINRAIHCTFGISSRRDV